MNQRQVVVHLLLLADQQLTKALVPRAGTLDAPTVGQMTFMFTAPFRFHSPGAVPDSPGIKLLDERGQQLPGQFEPTDTGYWSVWPLGEPVMPGESCSLKIITDASVEKQGELWVYESDWSWGYRSNRYCDTVVLPREAAIVSVSPEPEMRFRWAGLPGVRFKAQRGPNEHFRYRIKYRLPH